jgi:hypothetical protein
MRRRSWRRGSTKQADFQPSPKTRVRITMAREGGTAFALPPVGIAGGAIAQSIVLLVSVGLMLAARYYQFPLLIVAPWGVLNFLLFVWIYRLWTAGANRHRQMARCA